jgi:hypothetical protein
MPTVTFKAVINEESFGEGLGVPTLVHEDERD